MELQELNENSMFDSKNTIEKSVIINIWEKLVDNVFIISLKECECRREKIKKELERIGITKYEFLIIEKDKEDTKRGCFNSHQAIAKLGLWKNYDRILVLEDDAIFIEKIEKIHKSIECLLKYISKLEFQKEDFSIFYLGHLPIGKLKKVDTKIVKTKNSRYTHAYVLSKSGMQSIADLKYRNYHYDYETSLIPKQYALYPMISYQDDVASVNDFNKIYKFLAKFRNKISCKRLCIIAEKFCYNFLF